VYRRALCLNVSGSSLVIVLRHDECPVLCLVVFLCLCLEYGICMCACTFRSLLCTGRGDDRAGSCYCNDLVLGECYFRSFCPMRDGCVFEFGGIFVASRKRAAERLRESIQN
jgi:hypothetical protein